jgi:hypothetical protein
MLITTLCVRPYTFQAVGPGPGSVLRCITRLLFRTHYLVWDVHGNNIYTLLYTNCRMAKPVALMLWLDVRW